MNRRIDMIKAIDTDKQQGYEVAFSQEKQDWSIEFRLFLHRDRWNGEVRIWAPKAGTNHPIRWSVYEHREQAFEACRIQVFLWVEEYAKNYPGANIPQFVIDVSKPITSQLELFD